jgi:UDP-N-acetylglucosamine:LPS N-acetylglucosamine transferase
MKFTDTISKEELPLGPNVLVVPWVDYNDVLGHPATRLFISHCGVHSMYEAAFHGVPVLALPFTPDQGECAVRFTQTGVGLAVPEAVAFRSSQNPLVFQRDKLVEMANQVGAGINQVLKGCTCNA